MATKFADISKSPRDLLTDDFTSAISLKCKKSAGPVAVTIETERGSGGALSSKIGTKFTYAGLSFDKVQVKADGGYVLESSLKVAPGVLVSFKGNKGADLCVDYTNGNILATGILDVKDMSKISTSACIGLPSGIKVGGDLTYGLSGKTGVTGANLGGSYATGPLFASLTTTSKFSQFNIGLLYKVTPELTLASQTSHSSAKPVDVLSIGGAYKDSKAGTVKAKFGSDGTISACLIREVAPAVTFTGSVSLTTSGENLKYGLGISM
ncbi:Eukaryotic porin [Fragilaria crotonensis]|nr:Eukaryotic porin [Fragilaria crotonensis]